MNARPIVSRRMAPLLATMAWATAALSDPCIADDIHQVPLVDRLTLMTAVVKESQGDYEAVAVFRDLTPVSFKITASAEAPDDSGEVREITVSRIVRRVDLRNAKTLRT